MSIQTSIYFKLLLLCHHPKRINLHVHWGKGYSVIMSAPSPPVASDRLSSSSISTKEMRGAPSSSVSLSTGILDASERLLESRQYSHKKSILFLMEQKSLSSPRTQSKDAHLCRCWRSFLEPHLPPSLPGSPGIAYRKKEKKYKKYSTIYLLKGIYKGGNNSLSPIIQFKLHFLNWSFVLIWLNTCSTKIYIIYFLI